MSGFIERLQGPTRRDPPGPGVYAVGSAEADAALDALGAETSREVYASLVDAPGTPSDIADRIDTTLQNVHYHVSKLTDAGLVEAVDERYSEKGYEMTVYGPTSDPVVFVGDETSRPAVERSLTDLLAGVGLLALGSLIVQAAAGLLSGRGVGADVVDPASTGTGDPTVLARLFDALEPGVVFFVGCLVIVSLLFLRSRR